VRFCAGILILLLATFAGLAAADAANDRRVALVIGNGRYLHVAPLTHTVDDAWLMSTTLGNKGFEVIDGFDLDYASMKAAISRFAEASYNADVALIYYAGHGIQISGKNYFIPIDADLTSPGGVKTRTIEIDALLKALPRAPAVGVVILDASRNNPMSTSTPTDPSTGSGGLAAVEANAASMGIGGIVIAYAADPNAIASDGTGSNSPYTASLARHLVEPNVEIKEALKRVHDEVMQATGGAQKPWATASLDHMVFLGVQAQQQPQIAPQTLGKAAPAPAQADATAQSAWEIERRVWDEASKRDSAVLFEAYLNRFPNGAFTDLARVNLERLRSTPPAAAAPPPVTSPAVADTPPAVADVANKASETPAAANTDAGSELTESALGLNRQAKVDIQQRLAAMGHDIDDIDGAFGSQTRQAIGAWQKEDGLPPTTFLTRKQYASLKLDSEEAVKNYRDQQAAKSATRKEKKAQSQRQAEAVARAKAKRNEERAAANARAAARAKAASATVSPPPPPRTPKFRNCKGIEGPFTVPITRSCPLSGYAY